MGLDMTLYKVSSSPLLEEGRVYSLEEIHRFPGDIVFFEREEIESPNYIGETIISKMTQVYEKTLEILFLDIIFEITGVRYKEGEINISFSSFSNNKWTYTVTKNDKKAFDLPLQKIIYEDIELGIFAESNKIIISGEPHICPYIVYSLEERYGVILEEIDYQRKGLNDEGWDMLPENCSYTDDKALIEKMVAVGGLSESFIDNWIDGKTVFHPWW